MDSIWISCRKISFAPFVDVKEGSIDVLLQTTETSLYGFRVEAIGYRHGCLSLQSSIRRHRSSSSSSSSSSNNGSSSNISRDCNSSNDNSGNSESIGVIVIQAPAAEGVAIGYIFFVCQKSRRSVFVF